ncbi:mRNA export factor Sac3 [Yamadazyma tenuis ATCC 10573]|uniref:Nuclear mRNA export factor n=1 Tax=Candida tenuis (strain ATCC 10573 / BCRC 21748 / CBS 615 / JCM 9827 / NBRC 10315 / NRRL Y-1498 / VKM Y-70) TaxID=590646 RepID=G3BE88_CANTC|nr:mRNA export factor Sac3 [Yamadazyma tenuis ATCC 10573]EGV60487.1 mRNA export factor Sac3 [Yamadazyma tenuis ATCC 10573]
MSAFGGKSFVPNNGSMVNQKPFGFTDNRDKRRENTQGNNNSGNRPTRQKNTKKTNQNQKDKQSQGANGHRPNRRKQNDSIKDNNNHESEYEDVLPEAKVIPRMNMKLQNYTEDETIVPRELPKYLQTQTRIIEPLFFQQDPWDKNNQEIMKQMEANNKGSDFQGLYEEFQKMRETERKKMEDLGLVDAENIRKDLNDAIVFQGTCLDMCPTFERVRRQLENNVKRLEKDPATDKISTDKAVKAFSRPAAGQPPPLPSEVRPPFVLMKTLDYLITNIVPKLPDAHSFVWDRTRSIRQDFTYQNYYGPEAIDCNERIVRIHLISLHIMAGNEVEYSQQQELEQFNKALQTLMEIYQDVRNRGGLCPNEPEFRAYYLLSHLRESEVEREIQNLPDYILYNDLVQLAIKFRSLSSQNNIVERGFKNGVGSLNLFVEFFRLVYKETTPFLMACLLETQFNEIRFYALKSMTRGYHTKGKAYDGDTLRAMLGFDTVEQMIKFIEYYDIDVINDHDVILIDLVNKEKLEKKYKINSLSEKPKLSQAFSKQIDKKINRNLAEFINCGKSNENLDLNEDVKAGSFADFMNKPSNGGFGAQSPAISGFASSASVFEEKQPAAIHVTMPTNNYQGQPPSFGGQAKTSMELNKVDSTKVSAPNTFQFNISEPPKRDSKVPLVDEKPKVSFNFGQQNQESKASVTRKPDQEPSISKSFSLEPPTETGSQFSNTQVAAPVKNPPTPAAVQVHNKLRDSAKFDEATKHIMNSIVSQTVTEELNKYLPKLIRHQNQQRERSRVINSLSKELYEAFLNEIVFKMATEVKAEAFFIKNIKITYIKKLKEVGNRLRVKQMIIQKRRNELNGIKFGSRSQDNLKRQLSNSSIASSAKRRQVWNETTIDEIVDKRNEIEKLWEPVNFKKFIERLSANLKIKIEVDHIDLKFLIVVENFKINYSKWLVNKLSLKANRQKAIYENHIKNDKINLVLESLPRKEHLNKEFFQNTSFILFECGLLQESDKFLNVEEKLSRDGLILKKILDLVNKYGEYKVQVLIMYWDISHSELNKETIQFHLGMEKLKYSVVSNVIVCDMSETNINEILTEGIDNIANNFNGEFSKRGERKRNVPEFKNPGKDIHVNNDKFKMSEIKMINKAKLDKKYAYLNKHSIINQSLINRSINTNQSLINRSINNQSFSAASNILDTSNITQVGNHSNMSILGGFGQEIIEESTPFGTPKKFVRPHGKVLPKNLQQLIDLTTKVKSKYKA